MISDIFYLIHIIDNRVNCSLLIRVKIAMPSTNVSWIFGSLVEVNNIWDIEIRVGSR